MNAARTPCQEDFERAWRELASKDWPPLDELARIAARYSLVRARATAIANGVQPDATPVAALPAPRPVQTPAHQLKRRREDAAPAYSTQLAASGEYARHDNE